MLVAQDRNERIVVQRAALRPPPTTYIGNFDASIRVTVLRSEIGQVRMSPSAVVDQLYCWMRSRMLAAEWSAVSVADGEVTS